MTIQYTLVIPCYNEENNIDLLIKKCHNILHDNQFEIILVNNGSIDNTGKLIDSYLKKYNNLNLVTVPINKGVGYGIFKGLSKSKGDIVGYTHADLQTDPNDFIKAIEWIEENSFLNKDFFVKGLRNSRGSIANIFTYFMTIFETILFYVVQLLPVEPHTHLYLLLQHLLKLSNSEHLNIQPTEHLEM